MPSNLKMLLWTVLAALVVFCYFWSAFAPARETVIVSAPLEKFKAHMLNEKNPVLVTTPIVSVDEFIAAAFKLVSVKRIEGDRGKNMYSFLILHPTQKDAQIDIQRPGAAAPVRVLVPANNVLILPFLWSWSCWGGEAGAGTSASAGTEIVRVNSALMALVGWR